MFPLTVSMADTVHEVRRPRPGDAIGAALRHVFPCPCAPEEMARLLRRLDQPR